jgi:hypothetical protein
MARNPYLTLVDVIEDELSDLEEAKKEAIDNEEKISKQIEDNFSEIEKMDSEVSERKERVAKIPREKGKLIKEKMKFMAIVLGGIIAINSLIFFGYTFDLIIKIIFMTAGSVMATGAGIVLYFETTKDSRKYLKSVKGKTVAEDQKWLDENNNLYEEKTRKILEEYVGPNTIRKKYNQEIISINNGIKVCNDVLDRLAVERKFTAYARFDEYIESLGENEVPVLEPANKTEILIKQ